MAGTIVKIKQSAVAGKKPSASDLQQGEIALNTADHTLYSKDGNGNIFQVTAQKIFDMGDSNGDVFIDAGDSNDALYAAPFNSYDGGGA